MNHQATPIQQHAGSDGHLTGAALTNHGERGIASEKSFFNGHVRAIARRTTRLLTAADKALLVAVLVIGVGLFYAMPKWLGRGGGGVEVRSGNTVVSRYTLDGNRTVAVPGPLGKTVVRIEAGKVSVIAAPCPNRTCMKTGPVDRHGGIIVCVPNRVVVRVGSGVPDDLDAVTQ
ncbi:MAG: NusG domain II-containing protein [Thermodesulfobacteriota bacterium]